MKNARPTHLKVVRWETNLKKLPKDSESLYLLHLVDKKTKASGWDVAYFITETIKGTNFNRWRGINSTNDVFVKSDMECPFKVAAWGKLKKDWVK